MLKGRRSRKVKDPYSRGVLNHLCIIPQAFLGTMTRSDSALTLTFSILYFIQLTELKRGRRNMRTHSYNLKEV